MRHMIKTAAAAQTDTELIAAPGSGKHIEIFGAYFSSDTQTVFSLEHGTTLLHRQYVAADGGQIPAFSPAGGFTALPDEKKAVLWKVPDNVALTYTSTASGNIVVEVWYEVLSK